MSKTIHKIPARKQNTNKSCSKLCSFPLAPAKMTAWDARHWREKMLMLFIAHGWLPLPLYLRSSQSLIYSFSQQHFEAEDSLPRAVLEELGFPWGKWTVMFVACSQTVYYKLPPAGTTSSKAAPLPATCARLSPWEPWGCSFAGGSSSLHHPTSFGIHLLSAPTLRKKHHQKNNTIKPDNIKVKKTLRKLAGT